MEKALDWPLASEAGISLVFLKLNGICGLGAYWRRLILGIVRREDTGWVISHRVV
jgi:hypothetical protein